MRSIGTVAMLWLVFAAGWAHAADKSTEKAEPPAGDARAAALMAAAAKSRYGWPADVIGLTGKFTWKIDGRTGEGAFAADFGPRPKTAVTVGDAAVKDEITHHIRSLIMHRAPTRGRPAPGYAVLVEDEDRGPLIVELNNEMNSAYRVKDGRMVQVNRTVHGLRFTIDVKRFEKMSDGRWHTTEYVVTSWEPDTGKRVSRREFTTLGFQNGDGPAFPKAERVVTHKDGKSSTLELEYSDVKFAHGKTDQVGR